MKTRLAPQHVRLAAVLLICAMGGLALWDSSDEEDSATSKKARVSRLPTELPDPNPEREFEQRSHVTLPGTRKNTRPIPDGALIAHSENLPAPEPEAPWDRVKRFRFEGYRTEELVVGTAKTQLDDVVAKIREDKRDAGALRAFNRSLQARSEVGGDAASDQAMLDFLRQAPDGVAGPVYYALCNDVIDFLVTSSPLSSERIEQLVAIVDDPACHRVVRDYVVQYFDIIHSRPEFREEAESHLMRWISAGQDSVPGSAMRGVEIAIQSGCFEGGQAVLEQAVMRHLAGGNIENQIAALSLGMTCRFPSMVSHVRRLTENTRTPFPLRIAAIHALGEIGERETDPALLQAQLRKPGGSRVRESIERAHAKLTSIR